MKITFVKIVIITLFALFTMPSFSADKTAKQPNMLPQLSKKAKQKIASGILVPMGGAVALTANECVGLGGKVDFNLKCPGQSACYVVNPDGVINKACITVAK